MRTLFLALMMCLGITSTTQYNLNWAEAPLNEIPIKYQLEHFNLKGPLKTSALLTSKNNFDKEGYFQSSTGGGNVEMTYDANHKPLTYSSWASESFRPIYQLEIDSYGRISGKRDVKTGRYFERYTYDKIGNWTGTLKGQDYRKTNSYIYSYDENNRLIKVEYYDTPKTIAWIDSYSYKSDGDFLLVSSSRINSSDPSMNSIDAIYYKIEVFYGQKKSDNVTYDKFGNVAIGVRHNGDSEGYSFQKLEYYDNENVNETLNPHNTVQKPINSDPKCSNGNCTDGFGTYKYDNGFYIGFFVSGKKHGFGIYTWASGNTYSGMWDHDSAEGYGEYNEKSGSFMKGEYKNGEIDGHGLKIFANNTREYGIYKNGNLVTNYECYSNGNTKGCVGGDCYNGYGQYIYDNGGKFTGFFKNGFMFLGTWTSSNGDFYSGQFGANNTFEGYGSFTFKDLDKYYGQYKNGKREGRGVFYYHVDRKLLAGEWKNDQIIKDYGFTE